MDCCQPFSNSRCTCVLAQHLREPVLQGLLPYKTISILFYLPCPSPVRVLRFLYFLCRLPPASRLSFTLPRDDKSFFLCNCGEVCRAFPCPNSSPVVSLFDGSRLWAANWLFWPTMAGQPSVSGQLTNVIIYEKRENRPQTILCTCCLHAIVCSLVSNSIISLSVLLDQVFMLHK